MTRGGCKGKKYCKPCFKKGEQLGCGQAGEGKLWDALKGFTKSVGEWVIKLIKKLGLKAGDYITKSREWIKNNPEKVKALLAVGVIVAEKKLGKDHPVTKGLDTVKDAHDKQKDKKAEAEKLAELADADDEQSGSGSGSMGGPAHVEHIPKGAYTHYPDLSMGSVNLTFPPAVELPEVPSTDDKK